MSHSNPVSERMHLAKKELQEKDKALKEKDEELKQIQGKSSAISQLLELQNVLP